MKDRFNWCFADCEKNEEEAADEIIDIMVKKQIRLCELKTIFKIVSRKLSEQVIQKAE